MESGFIKQTLLFFLVVVAVASATRDLNPKATTQFIKTSCTATTYPKLCFTSLSAHANKIQTNPELLTKAAIDVALSSTEATSGTVGSLLKGEGQVQLSPREVAAVTDCVEELRDSVAELRRSLSEMKNLRGGDGFEMRMSNIQTWMSAALTDEDTCSEGFAGKSMDGDVKAFVRQHVEEIAHLTSNALALVNRFADVHV